MNYTGDQLGMWLFRQKRSQSSFSRTYAVRKSAYSGLGVFVQEPQQLMDSFTDLEELNLFLIQSSQVASHAEPSEKNSERERLERKPSSSWMTCAAALKP